MEWLQVLTIIVSLLGGVFYIHSDIRDMKREMQQQSCRTDKLYEMFIQLLKENK
jgi:hypothetical protein